MNIRLKKNYWKKQFKRIVLHICAVHKCILPLFQIRNHRLSIYSLLVNIGKYCLQFPIYQFFWGVWNWNLDSMNITEKRCCTFTILCISRNVSTNQNRNPRSSAITCRKDIKTQNLNNPTVRVVETQVSAVDNHDNIFNGASKLPNELNISGFISSMWTCAFAV